MSNAHRIAEVSLIALAALGAAGCAQFRTPAGQPMHPVDAPASTTLVQPAPVPADPWRDGTEKLTLYARGVQIWRCEMSTGKPVWKFVGPRAELFDAAGTKVGCHMKGSDGPVWLMGEAGGITGKKELDRPSRSALAIPELRLSVVNARGLFKDAVAILRLDTVGGVAPSEGAACWDGQEVEVPYTATYVFLGSDR